jgi:hypothetical protein
LSFTWGGAGCRGETETYAFNITQARVDKSVDPITSQDIKIVVVVLSKGNC